MRAKKEKEKEEKKKALAEIYTMHAFVSIPDLNF